MTRTRKPSKKSGELPPPADSEGAGPTSADARGEEPSGSASSANAQRDAMPDPPVVDGGDDALATAPEAGETSVELRAPAADEPVVDGEPEVPLPVVLPEDILSGGDAAGERLPLEDDELGPGLEKAPPVAAGFGGRAVTTAEPVAAGASETGGTSEAGCGGDEDATSDAGMDAGEETMPDDESTCAGWLIGVGDEARAAGRPGAEPPPGRSESSRPAPGATEPMCSLGPLAISSA